MSEDSKDVQVVESIGAQDYSPECVKALNSQPSPPPSEFALALAQVIATAAAKAKSESDIHDMIDELSNQLIYGCVGVGIHPVELLARMKERATIAATTIEMQCKTCKASGKVKGMYSDNQYPCVNCNGTGSECLRIE